MKKIPWSETPESNAAYHKARQHAQLRANETGFDHGLAANNVMKEWEIRLLPRRENRYGHELMCEVVTCENITSCQPGHGPVG